MEKYLLHITVMERVEADSTAVVKALNDAVNLKTALHLLGTKGTERRLQGAPQVNKYNPEEYLKAAQVGLLFVEKHAVRAFAQDIDTNGMPQQLEEYHQAFARRSYTGQTT